MKQIADLRKKYTLGQNALSARVRVFLRVVKIKSVKKIPTYNNATCNVCANDPLKTERGPNRGKICVLAWGVHHINLTMAHFTEMEKTTRREKL